MQILFGHLTRNSCEKLRKGSKTLILWELGNVISVYNKLTDKYDNNCSLTSDRTINMLTPGN
jgi:hypothetical protein